MGFGSLLRNVNLDLLEQLSVAGKLTEEIFMLRIPVILCPFGMLCLSTRLTTEFTEYVPY